MKLGRRKGHAPNRSIPQKNRENGVMALEFAIKTGIASSELYSTSRDESGRKREIARTNDETQITVKRRALATRDLDSGKKAL